MVKLNTIVNFFLLAPILAYLLYWLFISVEYRTSSAKPDERLKRLVTQIAPLMKNREPEYYFATPFKKHERDGGVIRVLYKVSKQSSLKEILAAKHKIYSVTDAGLLNSNHEYLLTKIPPIVKNKKIAKMELAPFLLENAQVKTSPYYYSGYGSLFYIEKLGSNK